MTDRRHLCIEVGFQDGWLRGRVRAGEGAPAVEVSYVPNRVRELRATGFELYRLLESGPGGGWPEERFRSFGRKLEEDWLPLTKPGESPGLESTLVTIEAAQAEVLALPWEVLCTWKGFLALVSDFGIERRVPRQGPEPVIEPASLPLRLLFLAAGPQGLPVLDQEAEEEALQGVLAEAPGRFVAAGALTGTFEELQHALAREQPHILHLSGHGAVVEGEGRFFFETLDGKPDSVPVRDIAAAAVDSGVRLVVLNACQSGIAPDFDALAGMCQSLVASGIPYALGWAGLIHDPAALTFAEVFYRALAEHGSVHRAVSCARNGLVAMSEECGKPFWALPVLYTSLREPLDFAAAAGPDLPAGPASVTLWPAGLIGRRREIQLVLASLLEKNAVAVFVTGAHGLGKTALLELVLPPLAERLGMPIVRLTGTEAEPITGRSLLTTLTDAYRRLGQDFLADVLSDEARPLEERLLIAAGASYEIPLLCCLDGVEWMASEELQGIEDEKAFPLWAVISSLFSAEETRSRFLLGGCCQRFGELADRVVHLPLGELSAGDSRKLLLRDKALRERVESGDLPSHLLEYLVRYLGGIPGLLLRAREACAGISATALERELEAVCAGWIHPLDLPRLQSARSQSTSRKYRSLRRLTEDYFDEARLYHLYDLLHTAEGSSRAASFVLNLVCRVAVPLPAWELLSEAENQAELLRFVSLGKALGLILEVEDTDLGRCWRFSSLVRLWLLPVLQEGTRADAHRMAGRYFLLASLREPPWKDNPGWLSEDQEEASSTEPEEGDLLERLRPGWEESFQIAFEHFLLARDSEALSGCWPLLVRLVDRNQIDRADQLVDVALEENEHPNLLLVKAEIAEARGLPAELTEAYRRIVAAGDIPGALCSPSEAQARLAKLEGGTRDEPLREDLQLKVTSAVREAEERTRSRPGWNALLRELRSPGFFKGRLLSVQLEIATANAQVQGDFESARALAHQCLDMARQRGDLAGTVFALRRLGEIDYEDGRHDDSLQRLGEALRLASRLGDAGELAELLQLMANVEEQRANRREARVHLERAAQLLAPEGGPEGELRLLQRLVGLDLELKDFEKARQRLARALDYALENDDLELALEARSSLARVLHREGRSAESEEQLREGLRLAREKEDRSGVIAMLFHLGLLFAAEERHEEACAVFAEALRDTETHDREPFLSAIQLGLAEAQRSLARAPEARVTLERCLQATEEEGDWPTRAEALSLLADLELAESGPAAAIPHLEEARKICRVLNDLESYTAYTSRIATLHLEDGDAEIAEEILLSALRDLGEARRGRPEEEARLHCHLARLFQTRGDLKFALVSIASAWESVEDGPWMDGRYFVFRSFAKLAGALDQREACLQLLALGAVLRGVRTGSYEEDLWDLITQAEDWGKADDVSTIIEQCTEEYLADAAAWLMSKLLETCLEGLQPNE